MHCQTAESGSIESHGFSSGLSNPLDRSLRLTIFPDKYAATKKQLRISAREFAERITAIVRPSKGQLPYVKFGTFGGELSAGGSLRHTANMRTVEGIEADYDGEEMSIAWALAKLDDAGIAAIVAATASHRPEAPRYRIYCPFSRPLEPEERDALMARLMGVLDGVLAPESFTRPQSYYFGSIEGQDASRVEIVEGRAIDLAYELDAGALDKHGEPYGQRRVAANDDDDDDDDDDLRAEPDVDRITAALDSIPASRWDEDYHEWLKVGQALEHELGDAGKPLWDKASQRCVRYNAGEIEEKWGSFGRYHGAPVTIGTLYRLAKLHGEKPRATDQLTFHTPAECAAAPRCDYVWKHMLAGGNIACIFGAPGAGKSLLAPHIGYMAALGELAFGMRTKAGVVFYVAAEDATGLRQRVAALRLRHGDAPDFRVVGGVSNLFGEDGSDLEALAEAVAQQRPVLIVIDTLAMAFPGLEENDAKSMGRVVTVARRLAEHGAAVVLIHHDTKAEGSTPRGHSILNGALDMALYVRRDEDGTVRGKLTKNRNGTPDRDIAFTIAVEELGVDEEGDAITAALAEEATGSSAARPVTLSGGQRHALAILMRLEGDGRVSEEAWRDACIDGREVSQAPERESRKRTFNNVRKSLFEKRLIVFRDGNVALANGSDDDDD